MLDCGLLTTSQTAPKSGIRHLRRERGEMDLFSLFIGFHPDDVFGRTISVDGAELVIVFGAIAASLGIMVWFGNWWSR
jgi:hypothetical protein